MQIFKNDDAGYISWRDRHPDGVICNIPYTEGDHSWKAICSHKPSCPSLAVNKNGEQPWTTNSYFKVCTDNFQFAEGWIRDNAKLPNGWQLRRCKRCAP